MAGAKTRAPGSSGTAIFVHQYSGLGSRSGLRMRTKASSRGRSAGISRSTENTRSLVRSHSQIRSAAPRLDGTLPVKTGRLVVAQTVLVLGFVVEQLQHLGTILPAEALRLWRSLAL